MSERVKFNPPPAPSPEPQNLPTSDPLPAAGRPSRRAASSSRAASMCSVEPVDCRLATGGVLAPLGPVFAPAEPSPRVVTPSVALARAHLGYDMAVRGWRRRVSWPSDLRRTWLQGVSMRQASAVVKNQQSSDRRGRTF